MSGRHRDDEGKSTVPERACTEDETSATAKKGAKATAAACEFERAEDEFFSPDEEALADDDAAEDAEEDEEAGGHV